MRQISIKKTGMALGALLAMLLVASVALAQSGGGYDLSWSRVAGGGSTFSVGGDYELWGAAGQHDAGSMSGGDYAIGGGFWPGSAVEDEYDTYLPLALKRY
jgi:hypothetical protein